MKSNNPYIRRLENETPSDFLLRAASDPRMPIWQQAILQNEALNLVPLDDHIMGVHLLIESRN